MNLGADWSKGKSTDGVIYWDRDIDTTIYNNVKPSDMMIDLDNVDFGRILFKYDDGKLAEYSRAELIKLLKALNLGDK